MIDRKKNHTDDDNFHKLLLANKIFFGNPLIFPFEIEGRIIKKESGGER